MILSKKVLAVVLVPVCAAIVVALLVLFLNPPAPIEHPERETERGSTTVEPRQRAETPAATPGDPVGKGEFPAALPKPPIPASLASAFDESGGLVRRMKAVDALRRDQPPETLAALRWLLRKRGESEGLRNIVAEKLRECGEGHLVSDLTEMLWDEKETPKWRNYCVQHLCLCYEKEPETAVLDTIFKAAECDEKLVKICAVWSLALIATPRDERRLPDEETLANTRELALAALRDEKAHFLVREAGVQSCARLGLAEALPGIRKLALSGETKPTHLRIAAVAALGELKDAESAAFLEKLAKESRGQLRRAAELALRRIREAQAPEPSESTPPGQF